MIKQEVRKKIWEISGKMRCPKNFRCAESRFAVLCKAIDIGYENFLECLEPNPLDCKFAFSYDDSYICQCPLRVFIKKELKK